MADNLEAVTERLRVTEEKVEKNEKDIEKTQDVLLQIEHDHLAEKFKHIEAYDKAQTEHPEKMHTAWLRVMCKNSDMSTMKSKKSLTQQELTHIQAVAMASQQDKEDLRKGQEFRTLQNNAHFTLKSICKSAESIDSFVLNKQKVSNSEVKLLIEMICQSWALIKRITITEDDDAKIEKRDKQKQKAANTLYEVLKTRKRVAKNAYEEQVSEDDIKAWPRYILAHMVHKSPCTNTKQQTQNNKRKTWEEGPTDENIQEPRKNKTRRDTIPDDDINRWAEKLAKQGSKYARKKTPPYSQDLAFKETFDEAWNGGKDDWSCCKKAKSIYCSNCLLLGKLAIHDYNACRAEGNEFVVKKN